MKTSVKANKKNSDWIIAMYCDYGNPETKRLIRASYTKESAENSWFRLYKTFSKNGYRCWQENKKGKVIRDSNEN